MRINPKIDMFEIRICISADLHIAGVLSPHFLCSQRISRPFWLLKSCLKSSMFPTRPLTGTVVVDDPCRRPLHLAALIGGENVPTPLTHVRGAAHIRRATGREQLINNYCSYRLPLGRGRRFTAGVGHGVILSLQRFSSLSSLISILSRWQVN